MIVPILYFIGIKISFDFENLYFFTFSEIQTILDISYTAGDRMAYVRVCKTRYPGSIPGRLSNTSTHFLK